MPLTSDTIIIILVSFLAVTIIGWFIRLERRISRLLSGKKGGSLEESIIFAKKELERNNLWRKEIESYLSNVEQRLQEKLCEAKIVRFNAFQGTGEGGNQSFATALISEKGNGVVISSIFTRDRVSVYAKPIVKKDSSYGLTEEERIAIHEVGMSKPTEQLTK